MTLHILNYTHLEKNTNLFAILKKENAEYLERMTNLVYITSDLNTKIKIIEEEKASLVTSVRLVNEDNPAINHGSQVLRKCYDLKPSPVVSNQATNCKSTENEHHTQNDNNKKKQSTY